MQHGGIRTHSVQLVQLDVHPPETSFLFTVLSVSSNPQHYSLKNCIPHVQELRVKTLLVLLLGCLGRGNADLFYAIEFYLWMMHSFRNITKNNFLKTFHLLFCIILQF